MNIHLIACRSEVFVSRKAAVLRLVNVFSQMLDPRSDRERLGFQRQGFVIKHFKGVARAVTDRENDIVCLNHILLPVTLHNRGGYFPIRGMKARQLCFKQNRSAACDDFVSEIFDSELELVRADVRLRVIENFPGSAVTDKFLEYLSLSAVLCTCIQLAV